MSEDNLDPVPADRTANPLGLTMEPTAIPGVREVFVVASGKGGVGKSTVSCQVAVALAKRGHKVGLLDADIYGPSATMMLGLGGRALEVNPNQKLVPAEAHGVKVVSFGSLTNAAQPIIWRGPMVAKAIQQFCFEVEWGELDYLIVDLPPGTGDVQLTLVEQIPITGAVIVTTPQNVALLDAHKALSMFEQLDVSVLGVVENMSYFECSQCHHHEHVFGNKADAFSEQRKIPIVARVPLTAAICQSGDDGAPLATDEKVQALFTGVAERIEAHRS